MQGSCSADSDLIHDKPAKHQVSHDWDRTFIPSNKAIDDSVININWGNQAFVNGNATLTKKYEYEKQC